MILVQEWVPADMATLRSMLDDGNERLESTLWGTQKSDDNENSRYLAHSSAGHPSPVNDS